MNFYYLNNSGTRGVSIDSKGNREKLPVKIGDKTTLRSVYYWEQIGNFSVPWIRYKGKVVMLSEESPFAEKTIWEIYRLKK